MHACQTCHWQLKCRLSINPSVFLNGDYDIAIPAIVQFRGRLQLYKSKSRQFPPQIFMSGTQRYRWSIWMLALLRWSLVSSQFMMMNDIQAVDENDKLFFQLRLMKYLFDLRPASINPSSNFWSDGSNSGATTCMKPENASETIKWFKVYLGITKIYIYTYIYI